jgi:hypothetical protein
MKKLLTAPVAGLILIITGSCFNKSSQGNSDPYPSIAEQKKTLLAKPIVAPTRLLDSTQIVSDLIFLASDTCEGRKPGTAGHKAAMERILMRMRAEGVDSFNNSLIQTFESGTGNNVIGYMKGTKYPEQYIVVSAHYDHMGKRSSGTFYGADDNASGTACLLALVKYFKQHPHEYSVVFAAFDKEESGLKGAFAFTKDFVAQHGKNVKFNLNMDMIARSDNNEIYASGLYHNPSFRYLADKIQHRTNVQLLMGHDSGSGREDWTNQSDHYAFYKEGVPFVYLGVEDHEDYHRPTDTWQKINLGRYIENCNVVIMMLQQLKP